ncbi:MAG: hypothetical protein NC253_12390 [Ruminococcus sp.]|nr:hypothetical protein [Ruminococcus sp.]
MIKIFKFFKIFGNQYFGFWTFGLLLFAVQEIPYMVMPLFKLRTNPIMNMTESSPVLDIFEKILGTLCIAFMLFIVNENSNLFLPAEGKERIFFILAAIALLLNFIGWGIYFCGRQSVFVMMFFIVLMPPLYYFFIGLWRKNILLTVTAVPFLIIHFVHVLGNFKLEN